MSIVLPLVVVAAVIVVVAYNVRHLVMERPLERAWTPIGDVHPEQTYLAILTHYPLKAGRRTSRVLSYVRLVQRRLDRCEGLVGYAFRANFYRQQLWTLSVWTDEAALRTFVDDVTHQQASEDLTSYVERSETRKWWISGEDVPPSWDEALAQLDDAPSEPFNASKRDTSSVG